MEEHKKSFAELENEAFRQLNEFLFLIIYPNPIKRVVKVIIDNGLSTISMKYEKFLKIIQSTCNQKDFSGVTVSNHTFILFRKICKLTSPSILDNWLR